MKIAESKIQQECVIYFNNHYCLSNHNPRLVIFSVPNESESSRDVQKKINTGMMKGAADCIVLLPGENGPITIFAECKTITGYQSPAQKAFQERVEALGYVYFVYKSLSQFQEIMKPYLQKAGVI